MKEAQVICVSTGTKCINGEYMSDRGLALNDCHAEIIARRSLIRYLYTQLEFFLRSVDGEKKKIISLFKSCCCCSFSKIHILCRLSASNLCFHWFCGDSNTKEDHQKSIFVPCDKGGYRLKDNVQFHLYISTSPCGDARIFSPHEAGVEGKLASCFTATPRVSSQLGSAVFLVSSSLAFRQFCFVFYLIKFVCFPLMLHFN